jgi:hypothetical protein|tara:strand:+ start:99 stop:557 length:459 start_codon:yes stop_codon:yes gene_type:complete
MNRTIKCPDCDRVKSRFNDNASVRYSKVYDERIPDSEIIKALAETCDPIEEYIENDESTLHHCECCVQRYWAGKLHPFYATTLFYSYMFGEMKTAEKTAKELVNNFTNQDLLACLEHLGKSINICFDQLSERYPEIKQVLINTERRWRKSLE